MIVIPMAGASKRFFDAGYALPKYQLDLAGKTMFARVVDSFRHYFHSDSFLFIVRDIYDTPRFVEQALQASGIARYQVVVLPEETRGQADTVYQALPLAAVAEDEPLYIFNIDTVRHDYRKPSFTGVADGYLEVFRGPGTHWSFVDPGEDGRVLRAVEKQRISDLCSDGLYFFRNRGLFTRCFHAALEQARTDPAALPELYIAPLYNTLIGQGCDVRYELIDIDQLDFCGTPQEFRQLQAKLEESISR